MRVIFVPLQLRLASGLLLLAIPLAASQSLLASGAPWWDLPLQRAGVVSLLATGLFLPLIYWINSGRVWARWLMGGTGLTWFVLSVLNAVHVKSFWLALFVLFLGVYWLITWRWINIEMDRSFFSPRLKWYHGLPESIPGLTCCLEREGQKESFKVTRLDRDGVFIFKTNSNDQFKLSKNKKFELIFKFQDREVCYSAVPVRVFDHNKGFGLRFSHHSSDRFKELGDFIELLKGQGHA